MQSVVERTENGEAMAIQIGRRETQKPEAVNGGRKDEGDIPEGALPLPPLGRSINVVGAFESVDYRQTPHPKNSRDNSAFRSTTGTPIRSHVTRSGEWPPIDMRPTTATS